MDFLYLNISIKEFKDKIKDYIPHHEIKKLPEIGDVESNELRCGCGETHRLNYNEHYFIADGGLFKTVFLFPGCGYLNALKLKPHRVTIGTSLDIKTLFSTKFLANEPNFGFDNQPDFGGAIKKYFK